MKKGKLRKMLKDLGRAKRLLDKVKTPMRKYLDAGSTPYNPLYESVYEELYDATQALESALGRLEASNE